MHAGTRRSADSNDLAYTARRYPLRLLSLRTVSLRTRVPIRIRCLGRTDQGERLCVIIRGPIEACTITLVKNRERSRAQLGTAASCLSRSIWYSEVVVDGQRGAGGRLIVSETDKPNLSHYHCFRMDFPTKVHDTTPA